MEIPTTIPWLSVLVGAGVGYIGGKVSGAVDPMIGAAIGAGAGFTFAPVEAAFAVGVGAAELIGAEDALDLSPGESVIPSGTPPTKGGSVRPPARAQSVQMPAEGAVPTSRPTGKAPKSLCMSQWLRMSPSEQSKAKTTYQVTIRGGC